MSPASVSPRADKPPEPQASGGDAAWEQTRPTTPEEDTWALLALPPAARMRHVRALAALLTFPQDEKTGVRSAEQDRIAAAAGLHRDTFRDTRRELAAWGRILYRPGSGRGVNSRYWVVPVEPARSAAPPKKGGAPRPPFLVPGEKGGPAAVQGKRGVTVDPPFNGAVKGGSSPAKRGVRKSADQPQRSDKGFKTSRVVIFNHNKGAAEPHLAIAHSREDPEDPGGAHAPRTPSARAAAQAAHNDQEIIRGVREAIDARWPGENMNAWISDDEALTLFSAKRPKNGRAVRSPAAYMRKVLARFGSLDTLLAPIQCGTCRHALGGHYDECTSPGHTPEPEPPPPAPPAGVRSGERGVCARPDCREPFTANANGQRYCSERCRVREQIRRAKGTQEARRAAAQKF